MFAVHHMRTGEWRKFAIILQCSPYRLKIQKSYKSQTEVYGKHIIYYIYNISVRVYVYHHLFPLH